MNQYTDMDRKNPLLDQIYSNEHSKDIMSSKIVSTESNRMEFTQANTGLYGQAEYKQADFTPIFGHDDSVAKMYFEDKEAQHIPQFSSAFIDTFQPTNFEQMNMFMNQPSPYQHIEMNKAPSNEQDNMPFLPPVKDS